MSILRDLLSGLEACHERAIVHRDLKPDNVLFTEDRCAKLGDLGVAGPPSLSSQAATAGYHRPGEPKWCPMVLVDDLPGPPPQYLDGSTSLQ